MRTFGRRALARTSGGSSARRKVLARSGAAVLAALIATGGPGMGAASASLLGKITTATKTVVNNTVTTTTSAVTTTTTAVTTTTSTVTGTVGTVVDTTQSLVSGSSTSGPSTSAVEAPSVPAAPALPPVPELPALPQIPSLPGLPLPELPEVPDLPLPAPPATGDPDVDSIVATALAEATALLSGEVAWAKDQYASLGADPAGYLDGVQATVDAKVADLQSKGLMLALQLASKISPPTCKAIGELTHATGNVLGLDMGLLGSLSPSLQQLDTDTNKLLMEQYKAALTLLVGGLPPEVVAAAPQTGIVAALLSLLTANWKTTYYPPGGGAPVVSNTPAFLNLPILLDVDGHLGFDLCAVMTVDLSTLNINVTATKLPTAAATLPADVVAEALLGLVAPGIEANGSNLPNVFQTNTNIAGSVVDTTIKGAGPTLNQTLTLAGAIQFRWEHTKPAERSRFESSTAGGEGGAGTQLNYSASAKADKFTYAVKLGTLTLSNGTTPAPTSWEYCTSTKGFCSNAPAELAAVQTASLHFLASEPVKFDQSSGLLPPAAGSECPAIGLADAHFTAQKFWYGGQFVKDNGHVSVDSAGTPVTGCVAVSPILNNLPAGFSANQRIATWGTSASALIPAPALTKTGTATCPVATPSSNPLNTRWTYSILSSLVGYICHFPPVNVVAPSITGTPQVGATLSGSNGTWTPGAPNVPTFTYQWQRCDSSGASCTAIAGATTSSYTATADDAGSTLRRTVTATNLDGSASATSAASGVIQQPPAPSPVE